MCGKGHSSLSVQRGLKRKAGRGKPPRFSPDSRWGERENSHPGNSWRFQFKLDNLSLSGSLSGCLEMFMLVGSGVCVW